MGIGVIVLFFLLLLVGFPIVVSIAIPSVVYLLINGVPIEIISLRIQYALDS